MKIKKGDEETFHRKEWCDMVERTIMSTSLTFTVWSWIASSSRAYCTMPPTAVKKTCSCS